MELVNQKISKATLVLDTSASLAVSRLIANDSRFSSKRLMSFFLNPDGTQCVHLIEDPKKEFKLDFLEVIYYRELLHNENLKDHFVHNDEIRYSTSCRDFSATLSHVNVVLFAALSNKLIKQAILSSKPYAVVWKISDADLSLSKYEICIHKNCEIQIGEWTITYDEWFLNKINNLRKEKLPKETGGILLGSFDMERQKIFLLDTLIPTDNAEYPSFFYRGIKGLREKLEQTQKVTANMITYVGEWHSHPKGYSTQPSNDDLKLLAWLTENMATEGLPALMLILGDNDNFHICFGKEIEA